jgi:cobalt-zinc-cadmium efflux system protein
MTRETDPKHGHGGHGHEHGKGDRDQADHAHGPDHNHGSGGRLVRDHSRHDHAGQGDQDSAAGAPHDHDDARSHDHTGHDHASHDHAAHGLFHSHSHGDHHHGQNASERRLWWSLSVLAAFTVFEAVGGFLSHSIALLAESAHMLADCGSLVLAVLAIRVSRRPARPDRTYGHRRYQPLAAYTNGLLLLAITVGVVVEAARRLMSVPEVDGALMMGVAFAGGVANFVAFLILSGGSSLNERGARAHVLSDLLGSVAAIIGAGIILFFHWYPADPLLSLAVSVLILRSGWGLTRDSAQVLLEGTPPGFDAAAVERELAGLPNVKSVHHIHAWSLTGETPIVTLHADCDDGADRKAVLETVTGTLRRRFGVEHVTVQIEYGECVDADQDVDCHEPHSMQSP